MTNLNTCIKTASGTIVTPKGRMSYAQFILRPGDKKTAKGQDKYSLSLLIPPGSDLTLLKEDASRAIREKFPALPDHKKKSLKSPFLDAYEKTGDEAFKDWTLLRVSTTVKPAIVDARGQHVSDESEVYSGRWARISVRAGGYDVDGNIGCSFFLSNVQLLDHDEALGGGRSRPENEFVPVEGTAESAENLFS